MPILCRHCLEQSDHLYGEMRRDEYNIVHMFDHDDHGATRADRLVDGIGGKNQAQAGVAEPKLPASNKKKPSRKILTKPRDPIL